MKKVKRILAMLMAMAMVLGMAVTASAEGSATITVKNAEQAELEVLQVIAPDSTTATGWAFINGGRNEYLTAFGYTVELDEAVNNTNAQKVIAAMIKYQDSTATFTDETLSTVTAATAAQIDKALSNVAQNLAGSFGSMTNGTSVSSAGIYAITAQEAGYTYKTMGAYVGFGKVEGQEYPTLQSAEVEAKKAPNTVDKTNSDEDKVVAIGDVVEFTITANFPYIDPNATTKEYKIKDTITGAEYVLENGVLKNATVTVGGEPLILVAGENGNFTVEGNSFTIDLSSFITPDNINANDSIEIKYTATVNATAVNNKVTSTFDETGKTDYIYTGQITLTKYAEDGTTLLPGAGFILMATMPDEGNNESGTEDPMGVATKTVYATFDSENNFTGWVDSEEDATEVMTGEDGTLVVKGLDIGSYHFKEVTAPEGYSINAEGANAELAVEGEATATIEVTTSLKDTKLAALPATGGIGTYIFTIAGIIIMAAAAGFFFVSRRKANR